MSLTAQGNELSIGVNGVSLFEIELYEVEGPFKGMEDTLEQLIETVLLEQLLKQLAGGALGSFPLPEFDLGGVVPGVPGGTKLVLGDLGIAKKKGYLQIEGSLNQP